MKSLKKKNKKKKEMAVHGNINWGKWNVQQIRGTKKGILRTSKALWGEKKGKYMFL